MCVKGGRAAGDASPAAPWLLLLARLSPPPHLQVRAELDLAEIKADPKKEKAKEPAKEKEPKEEKEEEGKKGTEKQSVREGGGELARPLRWSFGVGGWLGLRGPPVFPPGGRGRAEACSLQVPGRHPAGIPALHR